MVYGPLKRTRVLISAALISVTMCAKPQSVSAEEAAPYCDPMAGLLSDDFTPTRLSDVSNATEAARAKAETSPFANACQDPSLFKDRPPTGLFRRSVPLTDSAGRSSAEFLKRVGASVLESMSREELRLSITDDCLSGKQAHDSTVCVDVRGKVSEIRSMVRVARIDLALAQTSGQMKTLLLQKGDFQINSDLNSAGTMKLTSWDPLDATEAKKTKRIMSEYASESHAEAKRRAANGQLGRVSAETFTSDAILAVRYTHGLHYIETLSRNPILQYLKSAKPTESEVLGAVQQIRKNLESDRAYAEKALRAASETSSYASYRGVRYKNGPLKEINPDALPLLDFTSHVENILQISPEYCGLAASLQYTKENRSIGNGLAIGVPLIVATLALPIVGQGLAVAVIGGAAGTGYAISSKFDRDLAANRFISKMNADSAEDYQKLDQADREFKISLALGPAMAVAGPGIRTATVGLRATRFGTWLAAKTLKAGKLAEQTTDAAAKNP